MLHSSHKAIPQHKKGYTQILLHKCSRLPAALNSTAPPAQHDPADRPQMFRCVATADVRVKVCKSDKRC